MESDEKKEHLTHMWLSHHLEYKGFKDVIDGMTIGSKEDKEVTIDEVNNDWKRLASFMVGKK